jgi:glycosyltransferase involved in cell wall biosynthesis
MNRRILYVQYSDPAAYPPIEHSSGLLAERGWDVVILGIGAIRDHGMELPARRRIREKRIPIFRGGWKQKLQYIWFVVWILCWTCLWRPRWIYASDPLCGPAVWFVRKLTSVCVVYHEHDSPNLDQDRSWFMRTVFRYRGRLGREAELCVLPQETRLAEFLRATERSGPAFCVWNCPRLEEVMDFNSGPGRGLIIYYHGSITRSRLPTQLIVAASRFNGAVRLRLAGYEPAGSVGYVGELMKLSKEKGAADLIDFAGTIPFRRDLLRTASGAHVGLSFVPKTSADINLRHMVGASNKPFDCMACGLPLLVTNLPEWVSTFVEPGFARACDPEDPDSIEVELRWYLDHPDERLEMSRICREKIRDAWNYESLFAPVLAHIENS